MHRMDSLGVIENPFREGSLPRVNVGADTDVSQTMNILSHEKLRFRNSLRSKDCQGLPLQENEKEGSGEPSFKHT
jgi:hypothetical protein